jgi:hypothetical protein
VSLSKTIPSLSKMNPVGQAVTSVLIINYPLKTLSIIY